PRPRDALRPEGRRPRARGPLRANGRTAGRQHRRRLARRGDRRAEDRAGGLVRGCPRVLWLALEPVDRDPGPVQVALVLADVEDALQPLEALVVPRLEGVV